MLDTRLITFLTLLEEKSYTKTANKLYITQPAVTHHIKSLEKDNNITLFKDNKTFELTQGGQLLKEYAMVAKQQYLQFENALSRQSDKIIANMALTPMVSSCLAGLDLQSLLANQNVKLNIMEYGYAKIVEALLEGSVDFAIIDNSFDSSLFDSVILSSANLVLICNPNGQYRSKERITREQLSTATLVLGEEGSGLYRCTKNAVQQKNIRLRHNTILHTNSTEWMIRQILLYDGIGFIYYDCVKEYLNKGIVRRIELLNFQASQNIYLMYNRTSFLDNRVISFIDDLKNYKEN